MKNDLFRIYQSEDQDHYLGKIKAYLDDRPGSIASLANLFAARSLNITYFAYNRSEHPNRVMIEVTGKTKENLEAVRTSMIKNALLESRWNQAMELDVTDVKNILKIDVLLAHQPGQLGKFASLVQRHAANVIHMTYDSDISETTAAISLATRDPQEIDHLLKDMNEQNYVYGLHYKGAEQRAIDDVIGLNLIERFFLRLKQVLGTEDVKRLRQLVDSSKLLTNTLTRFSQELGTHYQEGEVLTNILAFATTSLSKSGAAFTYQQMPPLFFGAVTFHAFKLPTGANVYVLAGNNEAIMIDGSYGHYYQDVKKMLFQNGIEPRHIRRIYLTHADADHAGMSGYFAKEFGTEVFLHEQCRGVLENQNRLWGTDSPIKDLNQYFTILSNSLTEMKVPKDWKAYKSGPGKQLGGFTVIDSFSLSGQHYQVLECSSGHVPGQVFILSVDSGLIFTGDYLLLTESLTQTDRDVLNLPKMMLTSTNANSGLFKQEMGRLRELVLRFDEDLRAGNCEAMIVPGHGDYYPARRLREQKR